MSGGEKIPVRSMPVSRHAGTTRIDMPGDTRGEGRRGLQEERGWNTAGTRENERHPRRWDHTRRSRHLLDTAWACRVPRTRGTQHCTLLGAVPRRIVPQPVRATLWFEQIACDSNRHRHTTPRDANHLRLVLL